MWISIKLYVTTSCPQAAPYEKCMTVDMFWSLFWLCVSHWFVNVICFGPSALRVKSWANCLLPPRVRRLRHMKNAWLLVCSEVLFCFLFRTDLLMWYALGHLHSESNHEHVVPTSLENTPCFWSYAFASTLAYEDWFWYVYGTKEIWTLMHFSCLADPYG